MQRGTRWIVGGLLVLGISGCTAPAAEPQAEPAAAPVPIGTHFDAASAGSLRGRVHWVSDFPDVPDFEVRTLVTDATPPRPRVRRANPHAPAIDKTTRGVAGAVVFLRNVDPQRSRPWDHAPVLVEHIARTLRMSQASLHSSVGFVRQGDVATMVSREKEFNALHGSGAAFFTLAFPDAEKPLQRAFHSPGLVELSSGAGCYWMRSHLFVATHPYFARTDAAGHFELRQVPPGRYRVVCWLPNWHIARQDRDPESGLVTRVAFHPALELEREVVVEPRGEVDFDFAVASKAFAR